MSENKNKNDIKHLVLSGGVTNGLSTYGVLRELCVNNVWTIDNIQSIHCTSVGSIIGMVLLLEYDWEFLDDFLIKRPWGEVFKTDINAYIDAYDKCGLFDISAIDKCIRPLLSAKNIPTDITLQDFYQKTNVDLCIYTVNITTFELVCLSHRTHPEWKLLNSIYASSCVPMFFQPLIHNGEIYIDGGLLANYPLHECIRDTVDVKVDEILGINIYNTQSDIYSKPIEHIPNMMDYMTNILWKAVRTLRSNETEVELTNEIIIPIDGFTLSDLMEFVNVKTHREKLIQKGVLLAQEYIISNSEKTL